MHAHTHTLPPHPSSLTCPPHMRSAVSGSSPRSTLLGHPTPWRRGGWSPGQSSSSCTGAGPAQRSGGCARDTPGGRGGGGEGRRRGREEEGRSRQCAHLHRHAPYIAQHVSHPSTVDHITPVDYIAPDPHICSLPIPSHNNATLTTDYIDDMAVLLLSLEHHKSLQHTCSTHK